MIRSSFDESCNYTHLILSTLAAAVFATLTACGGGSGSGTTDTTPPQISSASTDTTGQYVYLTYNENLSPTTAAVGSFTVNVAGTNVAVNSVSISDSRVILKLSSAVIATNQAVTVTYTAPTANTDASNAAIQDIAGNDAVGFSGQSVTNNVSSAGGSSSTPVTAAPIDQYIGTWTSGCDTSDIVQVSNNQFAYVTSTFKATKLSDTTANLELRDTVYAANDSTCSGPSIGSVVRTGESTNSISPGASGITSSYGQNLLTFDAEATLSDGKKVNQLTLVESKLSSDSGPITAGQIKVQSADYVAATNKLIVYSLGGGKIVINGDRSNYPTTLDVVDATTFTKQ